MAEVELVPMGGLTKGRYIVIDGAACTVVDNTHSKPGKHGSAKSNIVAVGILDGKRRNLVGPAAQNVEVPVIEKRNAQVLSVTGESANVMDMETYETFDLQIPEEMSGTTLDPGAIIVYWVILDERVMKQLKSEGESDEAFNG